MINNFEAAKCPCCEEVLFYYNPNKSNKFLIKINCKNCNEKIIVKAKGGIFNE